MIKEILEKSEKEFDDKYSEVHLRHKGYWSEPDKDGECTAVREFFTNESENIKSFIRTHTIEVLGELEKLVETRFIDFSSKSLDQRMTMTDEDIAFMHGNNDLQDELLSLLMKELEEIKK